MSGVKVARIHYRRNGQPAPAVATLNPAGSITIRDESTGIIITTHPRTLVRHILGRNPNLTAVGIVRHFTAAQIEVDDLTTPDPEPVALESEFAPAPKVPMRITVTDGKTGELVARFANSDDARVFAEASTSNEYDDRTLHITDAKGYVNMHAADGIVVMH